MPSATAEGRFGERSDAVIFSDRRVTKAAQLRKDEPHPVAPLPACPQLAQHGVDNRLLHRYKALEIEPIECFDFEQRVASHPERCDGDLS